MATPKKTAAKAASTKKTSPKKVKATTSKKEVGETAENPSKTRSQSLPSCSR
jgi:hypothetical protein